MGEHIGTLKLCLGALAGGVLGSALGALLFQPTAFSQAATQPQAAAPAQERDSELARAVEALALEVKSLRELLRESAPSERRAVEADSQTGASSAQLLAAMNGLTAAMHAAQASGKLGVGGTPPLVLPPGGGNRIELARMLGDSEALQAFTLKVRFLTYQQVLDRFGAPDDVYANDRGPMWEYGLQNSEGDRHFFYFQFADGYLVSIDN